MNPAKVLLLFGQVVAFSIIVFNNLSQLTATLLESDRRYFILLSFAFIMISSTWFYLKNIHKDW